MSTMRHWKQRFDVGAELIFRKRMKLGICGVEIVERGDIVTDAMKEVLGRNRLRMWWNNKILEIANFHDPAEADRQRRAAATETKTEDSTADRMEHTGGGWYNVTLANRTVRIRGKKKAEALLADG